MQFSDDKADLIPRNYSPWIVNALYNITIELNETNMPCRQSHASAAAGNMDSAPHVANAGHRDVLR